MLKLTWLLRYAFERDTHIWILSGEKHHIVVPKFASTAFLQKKLHNKEVANLREQNTISDL